MANTGINSYLRFLFLQFSRNDINLRIKILIRNKSNHICTNYHLYTNSNVSQIEVDLILIINVTKVPPIKNNIL